MSMDFETLTLEREIACQPARLFGLLVDPAARAEWGAPDETSVIVVDEADIREGGYETSRCGPHDDPHFNTRSSFHLLRPDTCMINTEMLTVAGELLSVSLITHEVSAHKDGSILTVTLQIASLAGPDMADDYRDGWTASLDNLKHLAEESTT